jgi:hypothetical protein
MATATVVTAAAMAVIETDPATDTQLVSPMGSGATAASAGQETEAGLGLARARMLIQMKSVLGILLAVAAPGTDTVEVVGTVEETAAATTIAAAAVEARARALPAATEAVTTDTATAPPALVASATLTIDVAAAVVAPLRRSQPKTTATSAQFSSSRSRSARRCATSVLSSKPSALWLRPRSSRTE